MRKLVILPVAVCMAMLLSSCGGDDDSRQADASVTAQSTVVTESGTETATASSSPGSKATSPASPAATTSDTRGTATSATPGTASPPSGATPAPATPGGTAATQPTVAPGQPTPIATIRPLSTPTTAVPVGDATLSITSASGDSGQVVEVVLSVSTDSDLELGGWLVDVEYDPSLAQVESCESSDEGLCNEAFSANVVRFVGVSNGYKGELGRAKFRLTGAAGASVPLRITTRQCVDPVGAAVTCGVSDGTLRIN